MMVLAMAASYDPDPHDAEKIRLPFDLKTCEIIPERWANWLSFDPLTLAARYSNALQSLHALYIDVGIHDQYNIQFGSRQLVERFKELKIECQYQEFEGTHSSIDWRLNLALPHLAVALKNAVGGATC